MTTTAASNPIDPVLVSVIGNRFDAISREIGQTMLRTSRSPIFSEARDFVTGVFGADLRLIAQQAYIPVLMGALPSALRSIAREFAGDIEPGDVFILNDPYRGNNHAPDITVAKPVFVSGALAFWSVSKGHHADIGGGGVVGYNPAARSAWDEGLRIPPAKLLIGGQRNKALWDVLLMNVRMPWLVEADLECQIGACTIGERGLTALAAKYGVATLGAAADRIFDATERQVRAALRTVPNGTYRAERRIDSDGVDRTMIALRLALTIADGTAHFDWSASEPQTSGFVNSTLANTVSASYQALFMTICSGIKYNEGAVRALSVDAPLGTVLNPREPAPVTACTVITAEAMIETVWLALAEVVPERVYAAWGRWLSPTTMGLNAATGRPFGEIHFMGKSGGGASYGLDGWDHMGTVICAGGLRSPDPELHELINPYTVLQYEYWPDSAGPGQWRGGMGTVYRWRVDGDDIKAVNYGGGVHDDTCPYGLRGGHAAPISRVVLRRDARETELGIQSFLSLHSGDEIEVHVTGGGGYGDPRARDRARVLEDVSDGLVTPAQARAHYGLTEPGRD